MGHGAEDGEQWCGKGLPCRDRKSQLRASFVSLPGVQLRPWGIKRGPLSESSLHKSRRCGAAQRQAWGEAEEAVPMKPFRDSEPVTPVLPRVRLRSQGLESLFSRLLSK